jgi:hypothetical protein
MEQQQGKTNIEMVEQTAAADHQMPNSKDEGHHVMRSKADEVGVWRSVLLYKRVGCIAMVAAFCAALDGYRKTWCLRISRLSTKALTTLTEINLNGGIVANKGFIQQFANPGTSVIEGKYVSAWGGIQSAGQFFGQVVRSTLLT